MFDAFMQKYKEHRWFFLLPVFLIFIVLLRVNQVSFRFSQDEFFQEDVKSEGLIQDKVDAVVVHVPIPEEVKGIYWTASSAGSSRAQELLDYMKKYGLNTVVIDVKMDDGELAFVPKDVSLLPYVQESPAIADLESLLRQLADEGIYRIARIPVMRDGAFAFMHPELAMHSQNGGLWQDNIGSFWIDPAALEVADYAIKLAREAYQQGFDEVQFDYVRFASDGAVSQIVYPVYDGSESKVSVMQRFFKHVGGAMQAEGIPSSFDLFGMTFWSYNDFNIGQRLVDVLPYTDWISPMVYPSHYPDGFEGIVNPAEAPYEMVKWSLDEGTKLTRGYWSGSEKTLTTKWRPWLQDFDIGAVYTAEKIEAQIQAARDAGASGWILWNARNVYEPAYYE